MVQTAGRPASQVWVGIRTRVTESANAYLRNLSESLFNAIIFLLSKVYFELVPVTILKIVTASRIKWFLQTDFLISLEISSLLTTISTEQLHFPNPRRRWENLHQAKTTPACPFPAFFIHLHSSLLLVTIFIHWPYCGFASWELY